MPRLLVLDESVPVGLRGILTAFEVKAASGDGVGRDLSRAGSSWIWRRRPGSRSGSQQTATSAPKTVGGTKNSLVVLTPNHWDTIKAYLAAIAAACDGAGQGTYTVVNVARPPRRRRLPQCPQFPDPERPSLPAPAPCVNLRF